MNVVAKYLPLNTKEKVNELMTELEANPGLMTPALYSVPYSQG